MQVTPPWAWHCEGNGIVIIPCDSVGSARSGSLFLFCRRENQGFESMCEGLKAPF